MHLEKVTARSSEAGLAGWIASNDVTLFTMVLIMGVAIFLHSRVNKGLQNQEILSGEKAAVTATLASTARELDSARNLLDRTKATLQFTQEERDKLQLELVEKLAALAALNEKLDALLARHGELKTERMALLREQESLTQQRAALVANRDSLQGANMTLQEQLEALAAQLEKKLAALGEAEAERDRLKKQADELDAIVATLKQRLREMNIDLVQAKDESDVLRAAADARAQELQAKVTAGDKQAEEYLAQLKRAAALLNSLQSENQKLVDNLSEAERRRQAELAAEAENNRALIGIKGPVKRVAIIFDASGSMKQLGAGGGDRWLEAQEIASTWLQHINVEQCVLIVYSTGVRTFPDDGALADLRGADGVAKRQALLQHLKAITPGGWTNTYDALRKAYEYDVDTVLLFTDGAPSKDASGAYDDALARQIYQICKEHPNIPVNTIGLGNYFDKNMSTFLQTVANITGGAFRGE